MTDVKGDEIRMADADVYKALVDFAQSIVGHSDLKTLCRTLAAALRGLMPFEFLALLLHDPLRKKIWLNTLNMNGQYPEEDLALPIDPDHIIGDVWRKQMPVLLSPLGGLAEHDHVVSQAFAQGVRALLFIPLCNPLRHLGAVAVGFSSTFLPDEAQVQSIQRIIVQFAVLIDGFLTNRTLKHERDRTAVFFEIAHSLFSKLPINDLLPVISEQLSRVVEHDFADVGLLDDTTGEIHLTICSDVPAQFKREETITPAGLPAGEALTTGKPVVTSSADLERFPSPLFKSYVDYGFRSCCCVPLSNGTRIFGVVDLARLSGEPFTPDEIELLTQVAREAAVAIENALAYEEISTLKDKIASEKLCLEEQIRLDQNIGNMIGESPAFRAVLKQIQVVAPTDATVLIQGETGTGKELVARAIHDLSRRKGRSFIKVNCAAIPATLLESELFGHEKGSFTGASAQRIGRFELAHQGTLFLDEVGEIPIELQSKLLRAIQEQELERLGGSRTIHVDIRVLAATNRDLKQMVDEGRFRRDLYYRLNVFPLEVPPLRRRAEDIPLLIRYFAQKYSKRLDRDIEEIPSAHIKALTNYSWPGNIRELQNLIERSVILSPGQVLQIPIPAETSRNLNDDISDDSTQRTVILDALKKCQWVVSGPNGAATLLGVRRTTLQSRMKRLKITREYR